MTFQMHTLLKGSSGYLKHKAMDFGSKQSGWIINQLDNPVFSSYKINTIMINNIIVSKIGYQIIVDFYKI